MRRIAFVSADLRPGGGVADYVHRLSAELQRDGHTTLACDRGAQPLDEFAATTAQTLREGRADWVVFQLVAYGWSPKGILSGQHIAALRTALTGTGAHVAVFCHELWLAEARGEPLKHRLVGALQRRGVLKLLRALAPRCVLTSNPVYRAILAREGLAAPVLPLPGNLPLPDAASEAEADAWLTAKGLTGADAPLLACVFGSIHPEWDPAEALRDLHRHATARDRRVVLLTLGRHGPAGDGRLAALRATMPADFSILTGGPQPAPLLASLIARCDLSFATTPWAIIGKSGSAAACRDLGVPTIVTRDDWRWRRGPTPEPEPDPLLTRWPAGGTLDWPALLARKRPPAPQAAAIARRMMELLEAPAA